MTAQFLKEAVNAHRAGDTAKAEVLYRKVLSVEKHNPDALALLGVLLQENGLYEEATTLIKKAVVEDPSSPLFKFYLGNVLQARDDYLGAIDSYKKALDLDPALPMVCYNMGNAYRSMDKWSDALLCFDQAASLQPSFFLARNNLALANEHEGNLPAAIEILKKLVQDDPTYLEAWLNLCRLTEISGAYEESLVAGKKAVGLGPQNESAYLGMGLALNRLERHEEAAECYKKALIVAPERADLWDNLGQTYQFMNRLFEAEAAFKKTIEVAGQAIDEDILAVDEKRFGNRHWHLALLELLKGDLRRGFSRYRARFVDIGIFRVYPHKPVWRGEDIADKTILVHDEQGMGDTIMMARYLPLLKEKGAHVKFLVQDALVPLFQGWDGAHEIISRKDDPGAFDVYASVFDLPYAFQTTLDTIPAVVPYINKPIIEKKETPTVAIVWAGSPKHKHDARRSIPLAQFGALLQDRSIQFISLNKDMRPGDAEYLAKQPNVVDVGPSLKDFGEVARYLAQVDLVISCDTAITHLAGAMGIKAWTLLPFAPDWRWLLDRDDSPWYPTVRLFRQKESGDWSWPLAEIKNELTKTVRS